MLSWSRHDGVIFGSSNAIPMLAAFVTSLGAPRKPHSHALHPERVDLPRVKHGGEPFAILRASAGTETSVNIEDRCNKTTVTFSSADIDMDISSLHGVIHNNLGGIGPDGDGEFLRHGPVGALVDVDGNKEYIDVKITALTDYTSPNGPEVNGVKNEFGLINVGYGSRTKFRFEFMLHESDTLVTLPKFKLNMHELSTGPSSQTCSEVIGIDLDANSASYVVSDDTTLDIVEEGSTTWFRSTEVLGEEFVKHRSDDSSLGNHLSPDAITDEMKARAVEFSFSHVDSFTLDLAFSKPDFSTGTWDHDACFNGNSGRNFLYTFGPPRVLIPPIVEFGDLSGDACTVIHNNLGGLGPDSGAEELRYGPVAKFGGRDIDVTITALGNYTAGSQGTSINGMVTDYGIINVGYGTYTKLRFAPKYSGTDESVVRSACPSQAMRL